MAQILDVARRQLKLRHELSKIRYYSAGLGNDRLDVAHHRFVGQQTTDITLTLLHMLHDIRQRFGRTTGIVQNRENLLAGLINQRPDALGRIPLGHPLDHRVVPIELRALPAADIDKSRSRDAVPAADRSLAVAADEGARLVIDLRFCIHLLVWADDDPPDYPGMRSEDLHISADRKAGDTGLR